MSDSRGRAALRVVVVGGELAASLVAMAMTGCLDARRGAIRVVVSEPAAPEDGVATTLPLHELPRLRRLLDNDALLNVTAGTFSLGVALGGWAGRDATGFHPFSDIGAGLGPVAFHQLALRLRKEGVPVRLANYALAALAAQAGRFARPGSDSRSAMSTCRYGLHFDGVRLSAELRRQAEAAGVTFVQAPVQRVERSEDGRILALHTEGGTQVTGDLFVACGRQDTAGLLASGAGSWESWAQWLPADRVTVARLPPSGPAEPYRLAQAVETGWLQRVGLRDSTQVAVYSRNDTPAPLLLAQPGTATTHSAELRPGRRQSAWQGNCVAVGPAAVCIEPVAVSAFHQLCVDTERLLQMLPASSESARVAAEFNRVAASSADRARDVAIAHFCLNGRVGDGYWDQLRAAQLPDRLAYKQKQFLSRGRMVMYDDEPVTDQAWIYLLDEFGVKPRRHDPLANGFSVERLQQHMQRVRDLLLAELRGLPSHGEYLQNPGRKPTEGSN